MPSTLSPSRRMAPLLPGLGALALVACAPEAKPTLSDDALVGNNLENGLPEPETLTSWFTQPGFQQNAQVDGPMDDALAQLVNGAVVSVDLAARHLDFPDLETALIDARDRGVAVRIVVDPAGEGDPAFAKLKGEGFSFVTRDAPAGELRDSQVIVDGLGVWWSDGDLTLEDLSVNNSSALLSTHAAIVGAAQLNFEEYMAGRFGKAKVLGQAIATGDPGAVVGVGFGPVQQPSQLVADALQQARSEVWFAMGSVEDPAVVAGLVAAHEAGIFVAGVVDAQAAGAPGSLIGDLVGAGIPVYLDGNENVTGGVGGRMLHDLWVIDARGPSDQRAVLWSTGIGSFADAESSDSTVIYAQDGATIDQHQGELCSLFSIALPAAGVDPEINPAMDPAIDPWALPTDLCDDSFPIVRINEVLADAVGSDVGQEYVEIVNSGDGPADLSGWTLVDAGGKERHVFGEGVVLPGGGVIVVFDAGSHPDVPFAVLSSSGTLELDNGGDKLTLFMRDGTPVDGVAFDRSVPGTSFNRATDGGATGDMVPHDSIPGAVGRMSPGRRIDRGAW